VERHDRRASNHRRRKCGHTRRPGQRDRGGGSSERASVGDDRIKGGAMSSKNGPVLEPPAGARVGATGLSSGQQVTTAPSKTVRMGVIGYGYWGPNIVRNLHSLENCQLVAVCDKSPAALKRAQKVYPALKLTTDFNEILTAPDIDAVAVVTPVWTHFELAKAALENGKHVFVEKPFTSTPQQAEELIALADRRNLKIMRVHPFLFTGP